MDNKVQIIIDKSNANAKLDKDDSFKDFEYSSETSDHEVELSDEDKNQKDTTQQKQYVVGGEVFTLQDIFSAVEKDEYQEMSDGEKVFHDIDTSFEKLRKLSKQLEEQQQEVNFDINQPVVFTKLAPQSTNYVKSTEKSKNNNTYEHG